MYLLKLFIEDEYGNQSEEVYTSTDSDKLVDIEKSEKDKHEFSNDHCIYFSVLVDMEEITEGVWKY